MSAHNGGMEVGLTEIELIDSRGQYIPIPASHISVIPGLASMADHRALLSNKKRTTNGKDMWKGRMKGSQGGACYVTIQVYTPLKSPDVQTMKIWNYNVSLKGLGQGAKDAKVRVSMWTSS